MKNFYGKHIRVCPCKKKHTGILDCDLCFGNRKIHLIIEQQGDITLYSIRGKLFTGYTLEGELLRSETAHFLFRWYGTLRK